MRFVVRFDARSFVIVAYFYGMAYISLRRLAPRAASSDCFKGNESGVRSGTAAVLSENKSKLSAPSAAKALCIREHIRKERPASLSGFAAMTRRSCFNCLSSSGKQTKDFNSKRGETCPKIARFSPESQSFPQMRHIRRFVLCVGAIPRLTGRTARIQPRRAPRNRRWPRPVLPAARARRPATRPGTPAP